MSFRFSRFPRLFCLVSAADDLALIEDLALAGVDGFQVRDKSATSRELLELTRIVCAQAKPHGAMVVVNDRVDIALATEADGVHLGADDLPVRLARELAPDLLIGATCRDRDDVGRAAAEGASYAGFGPIRASTSKAGLPTPLGVAAIDRAKGVLPLVAIGGLGVGHVRPVLDAGADAAAVLAAIWSSDDPVRSAKELVAELG